MTALINQGLSEVIVLCHSTSGHEESVCCRDEGLEVAGNADGEGVAVADILGCRSKLARRSDQAALPRPSPIPRPRDLALELRSNSQATRRVASYLPVLPERQGPSSRKREDSKTLKACRPRFRLRPCFHPSKCRPGK